MLKIARQKNLMEAFAITGRSVLDIARLLFHPHVKMPPDYATQWEHNYRYHAA